MRNKLHLFSEFAATLLPHETARLLQWGKFADPEKTAILERVHRNCTQLGDPTPFDENIDKRKYSYIKTWIGDKLQDADADARFEWINNLERKITTDTITPEEEKKLLDAIRKAKATDYFFVKFYDLIQTFRHFLLIRLRHKEHREADLFLKKHAEAWNRSKIIYEKMHQATLDIVNHYSTGAVESKQWEQWLEEVFYDETLDGQNRYFALVRLIFIHHNYGRLSDLIDKLDHQDTLFSQGVYYSRRLLLNYYGQRLLLYSKLKNYEKAEYYGYLSLRGHNSDYLFYANNLAAILLRTKKNAQALALMKSVREEAKNTRNFYNRIGYVAFFMRSLVCNGQCKNAESYGASFLKAYAKEILEYRWHLFFTNYLSALFHIGKMTRLLSVCRQYKLLQRDQEYSQSASSYMPFIPWYYLLAEYLESGKGLPEMAAQIAAYLRSEGQKGDRAAQVQTFLEEIKPKIPELQALLTKLRVS